MSNINYFNTRKYTQINLNIYITNSIPASIYIELNPEHKKKIIKKIRSQSG